MFKRFAIGLAALIPLPMQCAPPEDPLPHFSHAIIRTDRWPHGVLVYYSGLYPAHGWVEAVIYCTPDRDGPVVEVYDKEWHSGNFGNTLLELRCPVGMPYLMKHFNPYFPAYDSWTYR